MLSLRFEIQLGQRNLAEAIEAIKPSSSFTRTLHCWEQQADEDADDRDHDEKLDYGEGAATATPGAPGWFHTANGGCSTQSSHITRQAMGVAPRGDSLATFQRMRRRP